jgi:hypothetical protein
MTNRSRPEDPASLSFVLDLVRNGAAVSQPAVMRLSGLGRSVVARRVSELKAVGLLQEGALGLSTGGRAPRQLIFRGDAGVLLVAELGGYGVFMCPRGDLIPARGGTSPNGGSITTPS